MESLERREPISLVGIWKNTIVVREETTGALLGTTEDRRQERKGMGAWAAPREDELGKVRYKPEGLGLYIDDPHATLKPELQRKENNPSGPSPSARVLAEGQDKRKETSEY